MTDTLEVRYGSYILAVKDVSLESLGEVLKVISSLITERGINGACAVLILRGYIAEWRYNNDPAFIRDMAP
jgi:hypothetical protein